MAKNLGRKFATMSEDERRNFALEEEEGNRELAFDEPRKEEGQHFASARDEIADPEHRDGLSAQLDDEGHERAVEEWTRRSNPLDPDLDQGDQDQPDDTNV